MGHLFGNMHAALDSQVALFMNVLQHLFDLTHNATAPPQQLTQQHHGGACAGGAATARADRPCLFIVKRSVTGYPPTIRCATAHPIVGRHWRQRDPD